MSCRVVDAGGWGGRCGCVMRRMVEVDGVVLLLQVLNAVKDPFFDR